MLQQLDERLVGVVEIDVRRGSLAGWRSAPDAATGYAASSAHSSAKAST